MPEDKTETHASRIPGVARMLGTLEEMKLIGEIQAKAGDLRRLLCEETHCEHLRRSLYSELTGEHIEDLPEELKAANWELMTAIDKYTDRIRELADAGIVLWI